AAQGIEEVRRVSSVSSNSYATVNAWFLARSDSYEAISALGESARSVELPSNTQIEIIPGGEDETPAMTMAASADVEDIVLTRDLEQRVVPGLEALSGVRSAVVIGHRPEVVQIAVDDDKMSDHGLTVENITETLELNGVVLPGGELDDTQHSLSVDV